jgi:hypothetical protein
VCDLQGKLAIDPGQTPPLVRRGRRLSGVVGVDNVFFVSGDSCRGRESLDALQDAVGTCDKSDKSDRSHRTTPVALLQLSLRVLATHLLKTRLEFRFFMVDLAVTAAAEGIVPRADPTANATALHPPTPIDRPLEIPLRHKRVEFAHPLLGPLVRPGNNEG